MLTLGDLGTWLVNHWAVAAGIAAGLAAAVRVGYHVFVRMRHADLADKEIAAVRREQTETEAKLGVTERKLAEAEATISKLQQENAVLRAKAERLEAEKIDQERDRERARQSPTQRGGPRQAAGGFAFDKTPPQAIPPAQYS